MYTRKPDLSDPRWGGYIPWFLRYKDFKAKGKFLLFFERLSQRLDRMFTYNEPSIPNLLHFGDWLETESLQRFRHDRTKLLNNQLKAYFNPETLKREFSIKIYQDPEVRKAQEILMHYEKSKNLIQLGARSSHFESREKTLQDLKTKIDTAKLQMEKAKQNKEDFVYMSIFNERLGVLEVLLRILPNSPWVTKLIADIKLFFAESEIMLDVKGVPPLISPMEEPMLQQEVIDNLLPRLSEKFPARAKELIQYYHDMRIGKDLDSIFINAFKSLEEIARSITGNKKFVFDQKNLTKYFPLLHQTIHVTIQKLADHRGDEAGHGKTGPDFHEIRYLLFSICNIALLLLDYPRNNEKILNTNETTD